jgi:predicted AlkP superfamily phosphohydrolase/phosphomutase
MSNKVLIIGLDGASWNVLNPMIESGYMSFLQDFIKNGKSGILKSTEPPITPTAWTSFMTGLPPEVHKIMGFRNFYMKDRKLQTRILSASSVSAERIWDILSKNNRRICLLNIPFTYPPFPVNGILISGFPVPSVNCAFTYPENFKNELFQMIPDFQVMQIDIDAIQKNIKKIEDVVALWNKSIYQKSELALALLKKEPWDVFMIHFQETDLLQHYLWHYIDKNHSEHNPYDFPKVAQFYLKLDNELSKVITDAKGRGFAILLLSDHGFQTCNCRFKANNWLFQKGYLVLNKNIKTNLSLIIKKIFDLQSMYKFKSKIKQKKPIEGITNRFLKSGINYKKSICFIDTNGTNISFAYFLTNNKRLIKKVLDELNLLSFDSYKIVREIRRTEKNSSTYKIIFADGIVASSSIMPNKKPFFETPKPFGIQHLGVHHSDGIIIFDENLKHYKLPENIFDVSKIIMKLQDIPFSPLAELKEIRSLTLKESTEIENQLKKLGYL